MRVRVKVSIAGLDFSYQPGEVAELAEDPAAAWLACGHAELLEPIDPKPGAEVGSYETGAPAAAVEAEQAPARKRKGK
jgi:hypothetical protein